MGDQNAVRKKLIAVLEQYGIKLTFISKTLDWDYSNLNKFKNDKLDISHERLQLLKDFLSKYKVD